MTEFDDIFEGLSNEDLEEQIKIYRKSIRHLTFAKGQAKTLENYDFQLPPLDIIEDIVDYCLDNDRNDDALLFCEFWVKQSPDTLEAKLVQCSILNLLSRFTEVLNLSSQILEEHPKCVEALINKAIATERTGNPNLALEIVSYALEFEPDDTNIIYIYAFLNKMSEKFRSAIDYYNLFLNQNNDTDDLELIYNVKLDIANCYTELEEYDDAIKILEELTNMQPYKKNLWYSIAIIYNFQEKFQKAIQALEVTLAIDDTFTPAFIELARIYYALGNYKESINYYRKAQVIKPEDVEILTGLSEAYIASQEYEEAISILKNLRTKNKMSDYANIQIDICNEYLKNKKLSKTNKYNK